MLTVTCPHCDEDLSYPKSVAGTTVGCLKCRQPITVPKLRKRRRREDDEPKRVRVLIGSSKPDPVHYSMLAFVVLLGLLLLLELVIKK